MTETFLDAKTVLGNPKSSTWKYFKFNDIDRSFAHCVLMDGVVVERKKPEHVRGDCVDAAVLERQLGFVNICFILTPVFVPCFLINIKKVIIGG